MFDNNVMLRKTSDGNLTASETSRPGVDFGGPDLVPVTYQVHVPQAAGTTPTLTVKIQVSSDNNTWVDYLTVPQITAAGEYRITGMANYRYRRAHLTVGGTSPNFGAVEIGAVPGGEYTSW